MKAHGLYSFLCRLVCGSVRIALEVDLPWKHWDEDAIVPLHQNEVTVELSVS